MLGLAVAASLVAVKQASAADTYYTMTIGVAQDPDELNPFAMILSISYTIDFLVFDTLTSVERDLSPGPQLAESWETSEDEMTWTFHLVEDAVWHDGEAVTAEDVAFTFNLILENQKEGALWLDYLSNVTYPVVAKDTYTVEITTDVPKATMLSIMIPILPEHLWSNVPTKDIDKVDIWNPDYFPNGPVGSGPLILDKWDSLNGVVTMLKNPDYFIDTVKVDEVRFKSFGDQDTMVSALWSGDIDVAMDVPAVLWDETLDYNFLGGQKSDALSFYELGINCASEEWREAFPKASENLETTNLSVRQAIAMVTDKDYIVDEVLLGMAAPGESIIPTATSFWHYNVSEEERWDLDFERANALLNDSGYGYNGNIRENETSGVDLDFSLYYRRGYLDEAKSAFKIQENLKRIGIQTTLNEVSEGVLYNVWLDCEYDLFIWGWDCDVDPNFMLSTMTEAQQPVDPKDTTKWGDAFWINEDYERMYIEQQQATNKTERQRIIFDMQELLYRECPYVVLYYPMGLNAYNTDRFTNYPDMETFAGATPGTMWFFFDVTPSDEWVEKQPPENVDAGPDQNCVVGETLAFSGYAEDEDTLEEDLTWSWKFVETNGTLGSAEGRDVTYTFLNTGNISVMLTVTDPENGVGTDTLSVNVTEPSETAGILKGYVRDGSGEPIVGALVDCGVNARTTFPVDAPLPAGIYSMYLEPEDYSVTASKLGFGTDTETANVTTANTTWLNFTLELTSGTVEGHVYDNETGEVIVAATVRITYGETVKNFTTNDEGYFRFLLVPVGTATVNVSKSGYASNETVVTVVAGETITLEVYLDPVDEGGGVSALLIAAVIAVALAAIAAILLLRKRGKGKEAGGELQEEELGPPPGV